jgi:hypothetical protein
VRSGLLGEAADLARDSRSQRQAGGGNTDERTDNRTAILATVTDLYNISGESGKVAELLERAKTTFRDSANADLRLQFIVLMPGSRGIPVKPMPPSAR